MLFHQPNRTYISQFIFFTVGAGAVVYAVLVLIHVSSSYDLGIRSVLTPHLVAKPLRAVKNANDEIPNSGDRIKRIAGLPGDIQTWSELLQAPGELHKLIASSPTTPEGIKIDKTTEQVFVDIVYTRADDPSTEHHTWCELRRYPVEELIPSLIWLFLKGSLFVIGALVYWKRPRDESAIRFYILCVITLSAYIGGYHWTQIVTEPALMVIFMACGILLPVTSLHFYLVFPRKHAWLEKYPLRTLAAVYGIPLANLIFLVGFYLYIRLFADSDSTSRQFLPWVIYATFGIAMLWYLACMATLIHSLRTLKNSIELKQVRCISIGIFFSLFPIGHSLYIVLAEPDRFAAGAVTWPMFGASTIVTLAFGIGMTRYRLMELDKIVTSGAGYFLVSVLAGLMYYGVVFVGTLFYSRFVSSPTLPAALTVSTTALLFVLALDAARSRIQRSLDRRFSRSKSQLDKTLEQMSQAVSQLVDPPVLAQRLLATVSDALVIGRGAIYLRSGEPASLRLAASQGGVPALEELPDQSPLMEIMRQGQGLQCDALTPGPGTPAQRQLRQMGGEIAQPLLCDGALTAILVLGPKDTPYRAEDWALLSAFAQITSVALESAASHKAIEQLNQDLQTKVDKIAEQQRRILALQTQLHRRAKVEPAPKKPETPPLGIKPEAEGAVPPNAAGIVGSSPVLRQLLTLVRKVAATDAVVLLRGESGTGKELLARAVHETSPRADQPYVKVHCAALSANLLESELFGHVKGAFTGAHKDKVGRFELANGGTLFLDEIGDISLEVQTKLLRVLQEKTIERVGSSEPMSVDVRIIAATHQNLETLIRQGRFREDLFYRLNVFPIQVPPLRERCEDIPELAVFFIRLSAQRCKKNVVQIDDDALAILKSYPWPGNIRQLENVIERAVVIAEVDTLTLQDMPAEIFQTQEESQAPTVPAYGPKEMESVPASSFRNDRDRFEREQLERALDAAGGNKSEAARILGIARSTLVSRMKKLGLEA
ncbi:MAG: AAA family ATPase [Gemmataceae bacterium]|nr:AAA family ATPase [Gemmataceae bacterium]